MNASLLFEIAVRSSLVLGAGLLAVQAMRRGSAAERHFVLALALGATALLPAAFLVLPGWDWKVRTAAVSESAPRVGATVGKGAPEKAAGASDFRPTYFSRSRAWSGGPWLAILILGAAGQAAWLAAGVWHLHGIRRRARDFDLPGELEIDVSAFPPIVLSDETNVAFLAGLFRPAIVLPAVASAWPARRLEMVLCHELAHLRRRDHWLVPVGGIVRVFYWWHPLAWLALMRLRKERERACDDMVISRFRASDYAEFLLLAARAAGAGGRPRPALAMAAPSNMETRVQALLDPSLSRRRTARETAGFVVVATIGAGMLASTVRLIAAESKVVPTDFITDAPGPTPARAAAKGEKQIAIEARLMEVSEPDAGRLRDVLDPVLNAGGPVSKEVLEKCLRGLDQAKGVDLMSAPRVRVLSGQTAKIEVTREFPYGADFKKDADGAIKPTRSESRKLGIEMQIEPELHKDRITLNGFLRITDFEGFVEGEGGVETPVFDVKEARLLREVIDGQSIGMWAWNREDEQTVSDRSPDGTEKLSRKVVTKRTAVFLTARLIDPSEISVPKPIARKSRLPTKEKMRSKLAIIVTAKLVVERPQTAADAQIRVKGYDASATPTPVTESPLAKAGRIIIPSIEFQEIELRDALDRIKHACAELDSETDPDRRGINLVLMLSGGVVPSKKVTLSRKNVSVLDALREVAKAARLEVYDGNWALSVR